MIEFRDRFCRENGLELHRPHEPRARGAQGINPFDHGSQKYTTIMKTQALDQALAKYRFDAAFGGARRDEEKSRAKERVYSFRDRVHQWDPKNQRPELWNLYNGRINKGESIRVFPALELDRARRLAVHPPREHPHRAALLRRAAPGRRARRHARSWWTTSACASCPARSREQRVRALPHARLLPAHRRDRVHARRRCPRSSGRCC